MKKAKICLCHHMNPKSVSISKQAHIQKLILEENGFEVFEIKTKGYTPLALRSFIKMVFKSKHFDCINVHACSFWGFLPIVYGYLCSKITNKKLFITYHGGALEKFYNNYSPIINLFMPKKTKIFVQSNFLKNTFEKFGYKNIEIIRNVVSSDFFRYANVKKDFSNPYFIVSRALEPQYNIKNAILAFKVIKKKYKDAKLLVVGGGSQMESLINYSKENNIVGIFFVGKVPNDLMSLYYSKCNYSINPTNVDNTPLSVIEAFAGGLCVISTNVGGVSELIENEVNGILVPGGNSASIDRLEKKSWASSMIAERADFLLSNTTIATKISESAREFSKSYSIRNVSNDLINIYKDL